MSGKLLLDTNAVSYFMAGSEVLRELMTDKELFVSCITEMELLSHSGLSKAERKNIKAFLAQCHIIELSEEIKQKSIQTRLLYRVKLPDAIIASTSLCLEVPLVTFDADFSKIKDLDLILLA